MLGLATRSLRGSSTVAFSRLATVAQSSSGATASSLKPPLLLHDSNSSAMLQTRTMSAASVPRIQRAYPQYSVHGESHLLSIKMIIPGYRLIKGDSLVVDNSRKGRMLLEFTPRGADGAYMWNDQTRFALSTEEVGLFCHQLPQYPVELSRSGSSTGAPGSGDDDESNFGPITNDMPDKVLRITPAEGASVSFLLDYVRDGVGGQSPGIGQDGSDPMEVVAQAGEFEVIFSIMKTSLPILAGWAPLIDYAVQASIKEAASGGYGGSGGNGGGNSGGGGRFGGGGIASGGVPF